ncbi:MAG TPA: hypothetical protein VK783_03660 [Bacteroidia bacterium]|jgi:hypothetical protein|nr:hypothetical protein [Bacteroidia bacterium]
MIIKITKKLNRNILLCTRADGSFTSANLGAQLPFHDIAHYVTERKLGVKNGFYSLILQGETIERLSDKEVIKSLGVDSWLAEIFARALGALYTGACSIEQFIPLVYTEMSNRGQADSISVYNEDTVLEMYEEYKTLLDKWRELPDGGSIEMIF